MRSGTRPTRHWKRCQINGTTNPSAPAPGQSGALETTEAATVGLAPREGTGLHYPRRQCGSWRVALGELDVGRRPLVFESSIVIYRSKQASAEPFRPALRSLHFVQPCQRACNCAGSHRHRRTTNASVVFTQPIRQRQDPRCATRCFSQLLGAHSCCSAQSALRASQRCLRGWATRLTKPSVMLVCKQKGTALTAP